MLVVQSESKDYLQRDGTVFVTQKHHCYINIVTNKL